MEDHRKNKDGDDSAFLPGIDEDKDDDEAALELDSNPLKKEEEIQEDDTGND